MATRLKAMGLCVCGMIVLGLLMLTSRVKGVKWVARAAAPQQVQPALFLEPPYYGTVQVNSVYDHQYPIYNAEPASVNSTVVHYNDTTWQGTSSSCTIGTPSCYSGHNGIDYDLEYELVRAAAPGDVVYAGWDEPTIHGGSSLAGMGLYVHLRHDNDYDTLYGHMSVLRVHTNEQGICEADEFSCILGISGDTGWSSGPHLHFELEPPSSTRSTNPYGWIGATGQDPWENHPDGFASHDVWLRYPSITNGDVYPSGAPFTAPPITENEPGYATIDDGSTNYSETPNCWTVDNTAGWAGDHRYVTITTTTVNTCTARWNFPSYRSPDYYNVFVYVPSVNATTDAAQYTIRHTESPAHPWNKQSALARVNQLVYPNTYHPSSWVYVGTYYFDNQYGTDYVQLEAQPLDPAGTSRMAADAVRFAPVVYRTYLPLVVKRWPPIPDAPVLNSIYNPGGGSSYVVSWNSVDLATSYTLQEATNASFSGAVTRYYGSDTWWIATGKAPGTYYYRVKASNSWGDSGWSNTQQTAVWPTTTTFYSVADAMVRSGYPDSKYGGLSYMRAGYAGSAQVMRSLVRFDLSGIPSGTPIGQAKLWLYMYYSYDPPGNSRTIATYRVTSSWTEEDVTWNTQPGGSGLYGFTSIPHAAYGWYSFDVTDLVRGWVNGSYTNYGVWILGNESPTDPNYRAFRTHEGPTDLKPYLEITYGGGAGASSSRTGEEILPISPLATPEAPAMPETLRSPLPTPVP